MATNTDKIEELSKRVAKVEAQLENIRKETETIAGLAMQVTAIQVRLEYLRKETEVFAPISGAVAVLEQQVMDLREKTDESSRRRWSIVQLVVGVILGGAITLAGQIVVKYLLPDARPPEAKREQDGR